MSVRVERWMRAICLGILCLVLPTTAVGIDAAFVEQHAKRLHHLFINLDVQHDPDLAQAHELWMDGEALAACRQLADYLAQRERPSAYLQPLTPQPERLLRARDALEDRFHLQGFSETQPRKPDGKLDWSHTGPNDDKEWAWMLNRHQVFTDLLYAWNEKADAAYIDQLHELWQDWIQSHPYPARHTFSAAWRPLEVARRILDSWPHLFFDLPDTHPQTDRTRLLALASVLDHGDALHRFASFWGGNHLLTEKSALISLALIWPELQPSTNWLGEGIETLITEFEKQTYPDGAHKELTYHYQRVTVHQAQRVLEKLRTSGESQAVKRFEPLVESMWNYFIQVMRPDGTGPLNNAADIEWTQLHTEGIAEKYGRPDWTYILTRGESGEKPRMPPGRFFEYAGHLVLRNHWGSDADWAFFHLGPRGTAHDHDDHLHLSVTAAGRNLLTDSGRYRYQPGPWRDYFKGPRAHNLMLVNGQGPAPRPRKVNEALTADVDLSTARSRASGFSRFPANARDGRGPAEHRREVHYDDRGFWIVVDHLITFGPRDVEILWNFHPDVTAEEADRSVQLIDGPSDTLRRDLRGQKEPFIAGFYSPSYNTRFPRIQSVWSHKGSGPAQWVWLIQSPEEPMLFASAEIDRAANTLYLYCRDGNRHTVPVFLAH